MKGRDEGPKEWPTHLMAPDMGGKTSIDSTSSFTLV